MTTAPAAAAAVEVTEVEVTIHSKTNPGTANNVERTKDRDLAWSELMRKPKGIRTCDLDVMPFCVKCKLPIFMVEVKRQVPISIWAHTEYVRNMARLIGCPAYFIHHQPSEKKVTVTLLKPDGDLSVTATGTNEEYIAWVEKKRDEHVCRPK